MVATEPLVPVMEQVQGEFMTRAGIAPGQQVPARVESHLPQVWVAGGGEVCGQQVRH
jgi:hypothetical protein